MVNIILLGVFNGWKLLEGYTLGSKITERSHWGGGSYDRGGNIWIMGKANGQEFTIDNQNFPTSGLYVANDLFLLKLDKNLNY